MTDRRLLRLCAAAFLADMALYLVMTGAPYKALALGVGPLLLGFVPVARALPYSLTTVWAGARTEGPERLRLARGSLLAAAAAAALLVVAPGIGALFALLAVIGFSLAFFWPAVQATLADAAARGRVTGDLGWFNIAWSTGKAVGFAVGGFLLAGFGFTALFATAAAALLGVAALVAFLRPARPPAGRPSGDRTTLDSLPGRSPTADDSMSFPALPDPAPASGPHPAARSFRLAAWLGNTMAFGIGAVLNTHYPDWLRTLGRGEALFGSYLGLIFASQTVTFLLLARFPGWHYRRLPVLSAQIPMIGVALLLPRLTQPAAILATAPAVGFGLGLAYFASLYYSVDAPVARGRNAGVHEALLGVGSMVLPVGGGWAAAAFGRLDAPYLFAAGAGIVTLALQAGLLARALPGTGGAPEGY